MDDLSEYEMEPLCTGTDTELDPEDEAYHENSDVDTDHEPPDFDISAEYDHQRIPSSSTHSPRSQVAAAEYQHKRMEPDQCTNSHQIVHLPASSVSKRDPNKIKVTVEIITDYILSFDEQHLLQIWHQIDIHKRDEISMEQFRKLLVLVVDQYIDSQMNAAQRDSHIVTTSLTLMKVAHSRGTTHGTTNTAPSGDDQWKPSVVFDCNEMMELEEMMGDMVKHARSAIVVDYLYDQFVLEMNQMSSYSSKHSSDSELNVTKAFYLSDFQNIYERTPQPAVLPLY